MTIDLHTALTIPDHVMARRVGEQSVLLNVESGVYFGLDALGARIWELLSAGRTLRAICDELAPTYDVPRSEFERDVLDLVGSLARANLVVPAAA
jgi:hypothetical protein